MMVLLRGFVVACDSCGQQYTNHGITIEEHDIDELCELAIVDGWHMELRDGDRFAVCQECLENKDCLLLIGQDA